MKKISLIALFVFIPAFLFSQEVKHELQEKINQIEDIWTGAYQKGDINYETLNAWLLKDTADTVYQWGIDQVRKIWNEFEKVLNDPLIDESKATLMLEEYKKNALGLINGITFNDPRNPQSIKLSMPGLNRTVVSRNMNISGIQNEWKKHLQELIDGTIAQWQGDSEEELTDRYTRIKLLDINAPDHVAVNNAMVREAFNYMLSLDRLHLTAERMVYWADKFSDLQASF